MPKPSKIVKELEIELDSLPYGKERVDVLNEIATLLSYDGDIQKAIILGEEAMQIAGNIGYESGVADAYWNTGKSYAKIGRFDEARENIEHALEIFENDGNANGMIRGLLGLGNVCFSQNKYYDALDWFFNALNVATISQKENPRGSIYGNIGYTYQIVGEFDLALEYEQKRLEFARKREIPEDIATALNGVGNIYFRTADYAKALEYFLQSQHIAEQENMEALQGILLGNIAMIYGKLDNYSAGLDYLNRSLKISEKRNDKDHQAFCLREIGVMFAGLGNDAVALNYFKKGLAMYQSAMNKLGESNALHSIANICQKLGEMDTALTYAMNSLKLREEIGFREGEAESRHFIGKHFFLLGNSAEGLEYLGKALAIVELIDAKHLLETVYSALAEAYQEVGDIKRSKDFARKRKETEKIIFAEDERKKTQKLMQNHEIEKTSKDHEIFRANDKFGVLTPDILRKIAERSAIGFKLAADNFTQPSIKLKRTISIKTLGKFFVQVDKHIVKNEDWQRKKARDVFKVLLLNYQKSVYTDELIELVWSNAAGKNLTPTLWNSVSFIRKALEPDLKPQQSSSFVKVTDKSYLLDFGDDAEIDFLQFEKLIEQAQNTSKISERLEFYRQSIGVYGGEFLAEDGVESWSKFTRERLHGYFADALTALGRAASSEKKNIDALEYSLRLITSDQTNEAGYEIALSALVSTDKKDEARKLWQKCQVAYKNELNSLPPERLVTFVNRNIS